MEEVINNMDVLSQAIMEIESGRTEDHLIRMAICDENGLVINTIVVDESWTGGGIPIGDFSVGIGCKYDFNENIFLHENGIPILSNTEIKNNMQSQLKNIS